jgi:hypothetical protein
MTFCWEDFWSDFRFGDLSIRRDVSGRCLLGSGCVVRRPERRVAGRRAIKSRRAFRAFSDVAKLFNFLLWFADRDGSWRISGRLSVVMSPFITDSQCFCFLEMGKIWNKIDAQSLNVSPL